MGSLPAQMIVSATLFPHLGISFKESVAARYFAVNHVISISLWRR